ncbi:type 1 fimbria pilin [Klebsiella oxytoca]|uniref:Type 1 fimbria pilin n=1 Tax=Klebsiella oxytoca TaxID=571 RepID=A0A318FCG3_KLEOX|nr:fimbrial protein [Klebsiella oxytoca]PXW39031.1 type 1 fimbria pilin [Klebsiella oxytoca]
MSKFSLFWQRLFFLLLLFLSISVKAEHNTFIQRGSGDINNHEGEGFLTFQIFRSAPNADYMVVLPHGQGRNPANVPELAQVNLSNIVTNISVTCSNGSGVDYVMLQIASVSSMLRSDKKTDYIGVAGEPLLSTTVPGLFVSIGMSEPSVAGNTNYFSDSSTMHYFPFSGANDLRLWTFGENQMGCKLMNQRMGDFNLKVTARFYVNSDFNPGPNQQFSGGEYTALLYSDDGNGSARAKLLFNIAGFRVGSPTCALSSVTSTESAALTANDSTGTNYTLALGSWAPSAIKNGYTRKVPFKIRLTGCLAVNRLGVEVSGVTSPDGKLFANTTETTRGGAGNVAVKLQSIRSSTESDLYPGRRIEYVDSFAPGAGVININTGEMIIGDSAGEFNMDFSAQLVQVDVAQPIEPGTVTGRTTFLFNYP